MLEQVQGAVEELPHQRLRGVSSGEWEKIADLSGTVDLFDATQIELPPTLANWQEASEENSGSELQLKLDGTDGQFKEALITKPDGNDNDYFENLLDPDAEDRSAGEAGGLYLFDCGYWSIDTYRSGRLVTFSSPSSTATSSRRRPASGLSPTRRPIRKPMRPVIGCCPTNTPGSGMIEQIETEEIRTDGIECSLRRHPRKRRFRF